MSFSELEAISDMKYPRKNFCVCYCDKYIYSVGGKAEMGEGCVKTCEAYSIMDKKSIKIADLNEPI